MALLRQLFTRVIVIVFILFFFCAGESDPPQPQHLRTGNRNGDRQVSLRPCGQFDGSLGGKGQPRRPARTLLRNQRRIHQSRHRHFPDGPLQPDHRQEGVQLQEDPQVRLQVAGQ
jgi:hypothetical protein